MILLAGCATTKDKVIPIGSTGVEMPPLSTDLETSCAEPRDKKGDNVYASRARWQVYGRCEHSKHVDTVNAYNRVRKARPKN
jgi:hypothetical protein